MGPQSETVQTRDNRLQEEKAVPTMDQIKSSEQTAVLDLYPSWDVDSSKLTVSQAATKFAAVYLVGFTRSLFICCRDVGRINHDAIDAFFPQTIVDPETRIAGLINGMIDCAGKISIQITGQNRWIGWL